MRALPFATPFHPSLWAILEEAVALDSAPLFSAYVEWLDALLMRYHLSHDEVCWSIDAVGESVVAALPVG